MASVLTGGCACREVRYECSEAPIIQLICHCRDCQRASGASGAAVIFVPNDRFELLKGKLKYYEVIGGSGRRIQRGFCPECGSPVLLWWPEQPAVRLLHAASLDDPSSFVPSVEVWVAQADNWHQFYPDTIKFDKAPSADAVRQRIETYFATRQ